MKNKKFRRYEDKPAPLTQQERDILEDDRLSILEDAKRLVAYGLRLGLLRFRFSNYEKQIHGNND